MSVIRWSAVLPPRAAAEEPPPPPAAAALNPYRSSTSRFPAARRSGRRPPNR